MLKIVESTTLTGYSEIDSLQVMSMVASITEESAVYPVISLTILSKDGFQTNFEQCKTDSGDFLTEALTRQYALLTSTEEEA